MSDQEQWTAGTLPSDAKIGTDDPAEEAAQIEGQIGGDLAEPEPAADSVETDVDPS